VTKKVIAQIARLLEAKSDITKTRPSAPEFLKWRRDALGALRSGFGSDSEHVSAFKQIQFDVPGALIDKGKNKARKLVHREGNVTKPLPLLIEHVQENHFRQAMAKAAELLLAAKLELERSKPAGTTRG
jgi:hypothetical protein